MQLILNFKTDRNFQNADFVCSASNREAYEWIQQDATKWPSPALLLHGPAGSGKTHLAHIWAEKTKAPFATLAELETANLASLCQRHPCIVLDNVEAEGREKTLFHLYNLAREHNGRLLLTHRQPLSAWPLTLPDLASRLKSAVICAIHPPDDTLLRAVLLKLFADHQLKINEDILAYLLRRIERSFAKAHQVVETLNACALESKRAITLPFVRESLAALASQDKEPL